MTRLRGFVLLSVVVVATALSSWAGVYVSVAIGPPALPVYSQPLCPGPGYIWTPGYWAYGPGGYYWVPGTWATAPQVGFLWTPGYWGFSAGLYNWHTGYWGPTVGFYGGINYGFGYTGVGYWGGYWHGRDFYYNRSVNNVNLTNIHNVYNRNVINNVNVNRVSYNGGPHGIQARPTSQEMTAERGQRVGSTSAQFQHEQLARNDRGQFASVNHGQPAVGTNQRSGAFSARGATGASQAATNRPAANTNAFNNSREVPRPPQNYQQQRAAANVPRPPQNSYSQQRASASVPRPQNNQQQTRSTWNASRPNNYASGQASQARNVQAQQRAQHANYASRQAAPQYRAAARPSTQSMIQRPSNQHQAAAHQPAARGGQGGHSAH
jgi:hypothetical protein